MKNTPFLWIVCFFTACLIDYDTEAMSLGNGPFPFIAFNYIYGSVKDVPEDLCNPPQNKNGSLGYLVYTQRNPDQPCHLQPTLEDLQRCQIDPRDKLVMLVSGFIESLKPESLYFVIKDKILANGPFTVIILNWTKYDGPPATLAMENMKKIGPLAADMLNFIIKHAGVNPENIILTGHSMGAHLVGYIGRNVPNLGRIDSLDPQYQFTETPPFYSKIQASDANFVRVIHSSFEVTSFGITEPLGDIDIYVNGGKEQPNCRVGRRFQRTSGDWVTIDSPSREYICPHEFINTYYIYSINNTDCQFWATQCDSYEDFKLGKCPPDSSVVTDMGFYGENVYGLPEKTKFFFRVDENPPYCLKDGYEAQSNCD